MKILFSLLVFPLVFGMCSFNKETALNDGISPQSVPNETKPFALVQLFTSQGCSSCPSADALLEKVKQEYSGKNVYVLSYHVDYWNRLGWKDVFSKKEFSDMQYSYSDKFSGSSVYTPQVVINGDVHFVGSSESKMDVNLSKYLKINPENTITISKVERKGNQINFEYTVEGNVSEKNLKIALAIDRKETAVKRGENSGKKLSSVNIVVEQIKIPLNKTTGKGNIAIPDLVENSDQLMLVGFTQNQNFDIGGATQEKV